MRVRTATLLLPMLATLALSSARPVAASEVQDAVSLLDLSGLWLFHDGDNLAFARPGLDDYGWEQLWLPTSEASWRHSWHGHGWYRRHIEVKPAAVGVELMLALGPAREVVEVYFNGALVAQRGAFGSRLRGDAWARHLLALVPAQLVVPGDNVIALRIYDPSWQGGLAKGPLLLGPPEDLRTRLSGANFTSMAIRLGLGLLALVICVGLLLIHVGLRESRDFWWLASAGLSLAVFLLDGTGALNPLVPNALLAARLPLVSGMLSILFLPSFIIARFGEIHARRVRTGQAVLAGLAVVMLLLGDIAIFYAGQPILLLSALAVTLYCAQLLARSMRQHGANALPLFLSLLGLAGLLVYDGIGASSRSLLPAWAAMGSVAALVVTTLAGARQAARQSEHVLRRMLQMKRRMAEQGAMGILEAAAMSIADPHGFLDLVVHQAAQELEVRRCSLALREPPDDSLKILAGVGLPRHTQDMVVDLDEPSIMAWVFRNGKPLTPADLPADLRTPVWQRQYATPSFVCQPVQSGGVVLGVLNVSDRNDGNPLSTTDEIAVAEAAEKLAVVLIRLANPAQIASRVEQRRRSTLLPQASSEGDFSAPWTATQPDLVPGSHDMDADASEFGEEEAESESGDTNERS